MLSPLEDSIFHKSLQKNPKILEISCQPENSSRFLLSNCKSITKLTFASGFWGYSTGELHSPVRSNVHVRVAENARGFRNATGLFAPVVNLNDTHQTPDRPVLQYPIQAFTTEPFTSSPPTPSKTTTVCLSDPVNFFPNPVDILVSPLFVPFTPPPPFNFTPLFSAKRKNFPSKF